MYIQKHLGNANEFRDIPTILKKVKDEAYNDTHTKIQVFVAYWTIDVQQHIVTYTRKSDWLPEGYLSTNHDWKWKHFDMKTTLTEHNYTIKHCDHQQLPKPIIWSDAMNNIRQAFDTETQNILHFHPYQVFDCRNQHLALNCNVMVFFLHIDGITMGHHLTLDTEHITVGFLLLNLKPNTKKSRYYFRIALIPKKEKAWGVEKILLLVQKEINTWKQGFPIQDEKDPSKFTMVYPIFLGILADGKEIGPLIGKLQIQSYAGALFLKECIKIHPTFVGTDKVPCFISRRFLTNSVCLRFA